MASVVLQNGQDSYCFSWEALKQFPGSLLANYAQLSEEEHREPYAAAVGATTRRQGVAFEGDRANRNCRTVVIPMQQLPRSPLTGWPQAPAVAHCLYSHHCITLDLLRPMLAGITGRTFPHFATPYEQLSGLIAYLNLPGDVSRWLPGLNTVSLRDGNLLSFACNIRALERQHGLPAAAAGRSVAAAGGSVAAAGSSTAATGPSAAAAGPSLAAAGASTVGNAASAQYSGSVEHESESQRLKVRAAAEDAVRLMLSYKSV